MNRTIYFAGNDTFKQHVIPFFGDVGLEETTDRRRADVIYVTYGGHYGPLRYLCSWLGRQTLVFHWIGSDVLRWQEGIRSKNPIKGLYYRLWRFLYRRKLRCGQLISLAVTSQLKEKLARIGIPATVFPITSIHRETIALADTLAQEERPNDVVGYIPFDSYEFYGGHLFTAVARELPHRRFVMVVPDRQEIGSEKRVIGSDRRVNGSERRMSGSERQMSDSERRVSGSERRVIADGAPVHVPDNVRVMPELSFTEMQRELASARCMLRLTRHDGLALLVLEALLHRMQVVWSQPFPYCEHVDPGQVTIGELAEVVEALLQENGLNQTGREYVLENYSVERMQEVFNALFRV